MTIYREIEKGKYANSDVFTHYEVIIEKREVLLLSDHRVIYCEKNDLFGGWQARNEKNLMIGQTPSNFTPNFFGHNFTQIHM